MNNNIYYLPIGTVIKLKEVEQPLIIIGYGGKLDNSEERYDYIAYGYPVGFTSSKQNYVFNISKIEKILCLGYKDENYENMLKIVKRRDENEK